MESRALGLLKQIDEGGEWPRGYGMAWRDLTTARAWCAPYPFNVAIAAVRRFYWWVRAGCGLASFSDLERQIYWRRRAERERDAAQVRCRELQNMLYLRRHPRRLP